MNRSTLLLMTGGSFVLAGLAWATFKHWFQEGSKKSPELQKSRQATGRSSAENVFKKDKCGHFHNPYLRKNEKLYERLVKMFKREEHVRRHPVMNLLGYLAVMNGDHKEGKRLFQKILQEDSTNINAMLNLIFTFKALGKEDDACRYRERIEQIYAGDESVCKASKARAHYELAEALVIAETYMEVGDEVMRHYYQDVLDESKHVEPFEQREWHFNFAFLCFKMHSWRGSEENYVHSMVNFYWVVSNEQFSLHSEDISNGDLYTEHVKKRMRDITPKAWNFMGTLMARDGAIRELGKIVNVVKPEHGRFTVKDCISKAMELTEDDESKSVIKRRIGQLYTKTGEMDEAYESLTEAVKLDPENGYGYELLGVWHLKKYEHDQSRSQNCLSDALRCFKQGLDKKCDLWHIYRNYAKTLFLLEDYDEALSFCKKAEELGGDRCDEELYNLWADILGESGQKTGEAEKRDMAKKIRNNEVPMTKEFFAVYSESDEDTVINIIDQIQRFCHVSGWSLGCDITPGKNEIDAWEPMQENSKFVLVFVSKNLTESYEELVVKEIISERLKAKKSDTIIPILLLGATREDVPPLMRNHRPIVYEESDVFFEKCYGLFHNK